MQVMSNGKIRRTEKEWQEILSQWRKSALTAREFCRKESIQPTSFQRWQQRLSESSIRAEFVPVVASATVTSTPTTSATSTWTVEVTLPNGVQLRFQG
jgi:hypothetical protein